MSATEDWLSDEKFDFDVGASPTTGDSCLINDEKGDEEGDDEEVFFGPQSFKEKCVATVVKEKEELVIEDLNPEQQALILRESALLSLMIKHGTPNSTRSSPVAVVRPMKHGNEKKESHHSRINTENKENIDMQAISSADNNTKLKTANILQRRISLKNRTASQPMSAVTRLPISKLRGKIQSDCSEQLIDHASLYGLSKDMPKKENIAGKRPVRRRSGLPTKQIPEVSSEKPRTAVPSLLQSAIPPRLKTNSASNGSSKLKPMKAVSSVSTVPQPQLRLPSARKVGTPSKSARPSGISSLKRQPDSKRIATPSMSSIPSNSKRFESSKRSSNSLTTPVKRTPSSRKSIAGRQLLPKKPEPSPIESRNSTSNTVNDSEATEQTKARTLPENKCGYQPPSHMDIISRYKKLCASRQDANEINKGVESKLDISPHNASAVDLPVSNGMGSPSDKSEITDKFEEQESLMKNNVKDKLLLELMSDSPLLQLSPVKTEENSLDPFNTGHTPPPLIDIGDVLQPVKAKDTNLIEF